MDERITYNDLMEAEARMLAEQTIEARDEYADLLEAFVAQDSAV